MNYLVASDIHGSAYYCRQLMEAYEREEADRLVLLGDLLYHGPRNSLPKDYATGDVITMLNAKKEEIFCVRGNCDTEVDQMVLDFPLLADYAVIACGKRMIYATHGHIYNTANPPRLCAGDILLHGHTHVPAWESFGEKNFYLNPGSVSIPKGGSAHSYMMLTETSAVWKSLDGETFHALDFD